MDKNDKWATGVRLISTMHLESNPLVPASVAYLAYLLYRRGNSSGYPGSLWFYSTVMEALF